LKKVYQVETGRQEWVMVMECICTDGSYIPSLIIFKGENLCRNWIPEDISEDWFISYNILGWISNIYGLEWLKRCFEPATWEKVNGRKCILIYDDHDSHISTDFINYYIQNDIILI
jgi:hypothetical protein